MMGLQQVDSRMHRPGAFRPRYSPWVAGAGVHVGASFSYPLHGLIG